MIINSVSPLREGGPQEQTGLPVNSVGKAGRPFEKPAVVVGVMPTAKRVLVQLSRRHAWNHKRRMLYRSTCVQLVLNAVAEKVTMIWGTLPIGVPWVRHGMVSGVSW